MNKALSIPGMLLILTLVLTWGCATGGGSLRGDGTVSSGSTVQVDHATTTLAGYLQRVPGVIVQGSGDNVRVMIRGASSFQGNNEPLFVVNGRRAGKGYRSVVNSVDVNDIDSIEVLKGPRASSTYGIEGSNGVIIIRTKRR
jgi:TonB-dependent SusC/RagA subfamily outer membrane receptor